MLKQHNVCTWLKKEKKLFCWFIGYIERIAYMHSLLGYWTTILLNSFFGVVCTTF